MTAKKRGRPLGSKNRPKDDTAPVRLKLKSDRPTAMACRVGGQFWVISLLVGGEYLDPRSALVHARLTAPLGIYQTLAEAAAAAYPERPLPPRGVCK